MEQEITKETLIILKLLDSVKDLMIMVESILEDPSPAQKNIIRRKLKIMKGRLPRTTDDINTLVKRRETKLLYFSNLPDVVKIL